MSAVRVFGISVGVVLLCSALLSSADADRSGLSSPADNPSTPSVAATIPPAGDLYDGGIHFGNVTPQVARAKISIKLPPLLFRTYLTICVYTHAGALSPCPFQVPNLPTLPPDPVGYPGTYLWDVALAENWVATPNSGGGPPAFGTFPPVSVSMLAFGSIPVTATLHITQTVHAGLIDPFKLTLATILPGVPAGFKIAGYPPAPAYPSADGLAAFVADGEIAGQVDIRIDDVKVDDVPLDVGASCRTSKAADLNLREIGGYYDVNTPLNALKGKPGEFQPLNAPNPGGNLSHGNVTIPSFSGCRDGNEDLDSLITAMVSGSTNPVSAYSDIGIQDWCAYPEARCTGQQAADQKSARALSAAAENADLPMSRKIATSMPHAAAPQVAATK